MLKGLRYSHPEDRGFFFCSPDRAIPGISVITRETTLTISDLIGETVSMESEIVRVVPLIRTEISESTRFKIRSSGSGYLNPLPDDKI